MTELLDPRPLSDSASLEGRDEAPVETYNLAERIYDQRTSTPPPPGESNGSRYNLAERVYGETSAPPRTGETNGAPYNLAQRVYGNGAAPSATLAAAVTSTAPPRGGTPPSVGTAVGALKAFESLRIPAYRWYTVSAPAKLQSWHRVVRVAYTQRALQLYTPLRVCIFDRYGVSAGVGAGVGA